MVNLKLALVCFWESVGCVHDEVGWVVVRKQVMVSKGETSWTC